MHQALQLTFVLHVPLPVKHSVLGICAGGGTVMAEWLLRGQRAACAEQTDRAEWMDAPAARQGHLLGRGHRGTGCAPGEALLYELRWESAGADASQAAITRENAQGRPPRVSGRHSRPVPSITCADGRHVARDLSGVDRAPWPRHLHVPVVDLEAAARVQLLGRQPV